MPPDIATHAMRFSGLISLHSKSDVGLSNASEYDARRTGRGQKPHRTMPIWDPTLLGPKPASNDLKKALEPWCEIIYVVPCLTSPPSFRSGDFKELDGNDVKMSQARHKKKLLLSSLRGSDSVRFQGFSQFVAACERGDIHKPQVRQ